MISEKRLGIETIVLKPGKALDNTNAHEMTEAICKAQGEGFKNIILDMEELQLLSSAGVGSILGTVEISRDMGGDIVLCGAGDKIVHILEVLDLCDYLTIKSKDEVDKQYHMQEVN
ncbi:MAG: STAS domain-containing protein [bacterium]|jgi:anti-anti-sigma factor